MYGENCAINVLKPKGGGPSFISCAVKLSGAQEPEPCVEGCMGVGQVTRASGMGKDATGKGNSEQKHRGMKPNDVCR